MSILCCCGSRRAPSSDNHVEPAQAAPLIPSPAPVRIRKTPFPVEVDMSPRGASLLATPMAQTAVDLTDLDIEDSEGEDEHEHANKRNSSTTTLEALKSKLIRRLSHRSQLKRQSQHGNSSQEEIARRAELKRIMHKRIQDELQLEQLGPEDEPKHDGISANGPRSAIEFIIFDELPQRTPMPPSPQLEPVHKPSGSVASLRLSTQLPPRGGEDASIAGQVVETAGLARREEAVQAGQEVVLQAEPASAQELAVQVAPETSQNASEATSTANKNSQSVQDAAPVLHDSPQSADGVTQAAHDGSTSVDDSTGRYSPLDMWLYTQDAQTNSEQYLQSSSRYSSKDDSENLPSAKNSDDGGNTRIAQSSKGPTVPVPDGPLKHDEATDSRDKSYVQSWRMTQGTEPVSSSNYTSPYDSQETPAAEASDASSYRTAPIEAMAPDMVDLLGELVQKPKGSMSQLSGTASFREREAELESVAQRFAGTNMPRDPGQAVVVSRFREDFDGPRQHKGRSKPAIFAKFHLSLPKKGKAHEKAKQPHRNCVADAIQASHLAAAGPNAHVAARGSRRFSTMSATEIRQGPPESATDLWQRAIRLEANSRNTRRREKEGQPGSHCYAGSVEVPESIGARTGEPVSHPVRQPSSAYSNTYLEVPSDVLLPTSQSGLVFNDPHVAQGALENSEETQSEPKPSFVTGMDSTQKKNRTPPLSWARWPSQDRVERAREASEDDIVTPKDFALGRTIGGEVRRSDDKNRPSPSAMGQRNPSMQTFPGRFGKAFRGSFSKLIKSAFELDPLVDGSSKNRDSRGFLEYPELELLPTPGGYKEAEALERHIDDFRRKSMVPLECAQHNDSANRPKISLNKGPAWEAHIMQGGNEYTPGASDDLLQTPPPILQEPSTPIRKRHSMIPFATPMTHISYDDCVQRHLLDDENESVKSVRAVEIKRSKSNAETKLPGQNKKVTGHGRARKLSALEKSAREFGAELKRVKANEGF